MADDTPEATPESPKRSARKPKQPEAQPGFKLVTCETDLRVVTKDFVVFRLQAGVTRELPEHLAYAAQGAAADKRVGITIA